LQNRQPASTSSGLETTKSEEHQQTNKQTNKPLKGKEVSPEEEPERLFRGKQPQLERCRDPSSLKIFFKMQCADKHGNPQATRLPTMKQRFKPLSDPKTTLEVPQGISVIQEGMISDKVTTAGPLQLSCWQGCLEG
jgi:hypothetical protein